MSDSSEENAAGDGRPLLAIVTGHLPPYREHFHRRIVREMPEIRLATLITKYKSGPWVNPVNAEVGAVAFETASPAIAGMGEKLLHERAKARRVVRWLDEHRPKAVLSIGYDELPNLHAVRWARRRGVPALLWADSNDRGDLATGLKRLVKNIYVPWICRRFARVLVCGSAGEAFFRRYGVADAKMGRMPVEPDYGLIETMDGARAEVLARETGVNADPERRRLVCCCRLVREKRVDLVIESFRAIAGERPTWDLLIVGEGPFRGDLERRSADLRAAARVRFLGFQDQEHVTGIYRSSHALVLASDYEPWALVINEAAAAGMAIVASDRVGAAYELVRDRVNGRIVRSGDGAALTDALRDVTTEGVAAQYGAASVERIAAWRREADPIAGLRAALRGAGIVG